jgi:hypothetical protein
VRSAAEAEEMNGKTAARKFTRQEIYMRSDSRSSLAKGFHYLAAALRRRTTAHMMVTSCGQISHRIFCDAMVFNDLSPIWLGGIALIGGLARSDRMDAMHL